MVAGGTIDLDEIATPEILDPQFRRLVPERSKLRFSRAWMPVKSKQVNYLLNPRY